MTLDPVDPKPYFRYTGLDRLVLTCGDIEPVEGYTISGSRHLEHTFDTHRFDWKRKEAGVFARLKSDPGQTPS